MKQNDSKYHLLYIAIKDADDYFPKEDRKEVLDLIKELYTENLDILQDKDSKGKYGIEYKTVHDDSKYHDTHKVFFRTKQKRDNVFEDWLNERYYDNIFNINLEYPTPTPNVFGITKIFKEGGKIYSEK